MTDSRPRAIIAMELGGAFVVAAIHVDMVEMSNEMVDVTMMSDTFAQYKDGPTHITVSGEIVKQLASARDEASGLARLAVDGVVIPKLLAEES